LQIEAVIYVYVKKNEVCTRTDKLPELYDCKMSKKSYCRPATNCELIITKYEWVEEQKERDRLPKKKADKHFEIMDSS